MSEVEKDLGILVDNKMNFKNHVAMATTKVNKILGIIRRSYDHLTPATSVLLYKFLVMPIIEYGNSVWQLRYKTLCCALEVVQRRAAKLIGS